MTIPQVTPGHFTVVALVLSALWGMWCARPIRGTDRD